ncbi:protein of unknown function [Psychrobacillus psychrotolerans]|uniref:Uncharacterized protein n=1 Tax=Psychrobacillus psychrotolerans TaxID=126156 RepID=A0A1I5UP38_9BACI|nr:DUF2019 domain-containing protein [Psychrobacillus psychrotolerans]SFP97025.1 protein of unknown function [Psychrobacillus psychrotolerans]
MKLEEIMENCIDSAILYGVSAYEVVVNPRKTNKLYDKQYKNFKLLKKHPKGVESLYHLLQHPNIYVRYISAIHLFSVDEKKAKEVIMTVATINKRLDPHYLFEEWDNGNLKEYYS